MKNTKVEVFDQSGETMKIGHMNYYWYQVKTKEGITGWVFGVFLTLQEAKSSETPKETNTQPNPLLHHHLLHAHRKNR